MNQAKILLTIPWCNNRHHHYHYHNHNFHYKYHHHHHHPPHTAVIPVTNTCHMHTPANTGAAPRQRSHTPPQTADTWGSWCVVAGGGHLSRAVNNKGKTEKVGDSYTLVLSCVTGSLRPPGVTCSGANFIRVSFCISSKNWGQMHFVSPGKETRKQYLTLLYKASSVVLWGCESLSLRSDVPLPNVHRHLTSPPFHSWKGEEIHDNRLPLN